jgi:hypothetical protein
VIDPVSDWTSLAGHRILIRKRGREVRCGEVEAVSLDGGTLWLRNEGVEPRVLFQKCDGYTAWTAVTFADAPVDHFTLYAD